MKGFARYIYSIGILVILIFSLVSDWHAPLSISLGILLLIQILDKMGRGIVLRESTAMLYVITCLLMPLVGYTYYTINNTLARLWVKYMPVPEDVYFNFALPAIACFCLAITFPLGSKDARDDGASLRAMIARVKEMLSNKPHLGISIMAIGIFMGIFARYLPGGLQFFGTLFFFGSFAGLLYVYYAPRFKYKKLAIGGFTAFIIVNALASGMFTIIAYMGITIYSFFILSKKLSFFKKVVILVVAVVFMIVLQNTKGAYRMLVWRSNYQGNTIELFARLFIENLSQGGGLVEEKAFFSMYTRTNQGYNVALVMRRMPSKQPHDYGVNLGRAFASALVPRFLWPDKPEAGGKFNMKFYAGMALRGSWSTNIGPLGEAYGSFGVPGGIAYMFFLGIFIRWAYQKTFRLSRSNPLLLCWIPVLFYQITYSAETDSLQICNSLLKSAFFVWALYKFVPTWFGMVSRKARRVLQRKVPSYTNVTQ